MQFLLKRNSNRDHFHCEMARECPASSIIRSSHFHHRIWLYQMHNRRRGAVDRRIVDSWWTIAHLPSHISYRPSKIDDRPSTDWWHMVDGSMVDRWSSGWVDGRLKLYGGWLVGHLQSTTVNRPFAIDHSIGPTFSLAIDHLNMSLQCIQPIHPNVVKTSTSSIFPVAAWPSRKVMKINPKQ